MAQLPPKIPNMTPNWPPDYNPHQKSTPFTTPNATHNPSWVDEFLNFSSTRRGSHRRSASDSTAFLEMPIIDECRDLPTRPASHNNDFERFDDEQFMSMFTDHEISTALAPSVSSSNPTTASDHNSVNDDQKDEAMQVQMQQKKNESEEVQSEMQNAITNATSAERISDPKRVKRILANRQSAQRSRVRKLQYISDLERSVSALQGEVSVLSPRVAFLDQQRLLLNVDNSALKQRIAALAQDKIFKDAHQEALKREIEILRQVYHQQNLKKMESSSPSPTTDVESNSGDQLNV